MKTSPPVEIKASKVRIKPEGPHSGKDPLLRVLERNYGVYDLFLKQIRLLWGQVMVLGLAILMAVFSFVHHPPPQYVQATPDGRLVAQVPLSQPNMGDAMLFDFSRKAITSVNRYDYINWRGQLSDAAGFFTPSGWDIYLKELASRKTLTTVRSENMVVSVKFTGAPVLDATRVMKMKDGTDRFIWKVDQPVQIVYTPSGVDTAGNPYNSLSQSGMVRLYVMRVPYTDSPRGVQVQVYNFKEEGQP